MSSVRWGWNVAVGPRPRIAPRNENETLVGSDELRGWSVEPMRGSLIPPQGHRPGLGDVVHAVSRSRRGDAECCPPLLVERSGESHVSIGDDIVRQRAPVAPRGPDVP